MASIYDKEIQMYILSAVKATECQSFKMVHTLKKKKIKDIKLVI